MNSTNVFYINSIETWNLAHVQRGPAGGGGVSSSHGLCPLLPPPPNLPQSGPVQKCAAYRSNVHAQQFAPNFYFPPPPTQINPGVTTLHVT